MRDRLADAMTDALSRMTHHALCDCTLFPDIPYILRPNLRDLLASILYQDRVSSCYIPNINIRCIYIATDTAFLPCYTYRACCTSAITPTLQIPRYCYTYRARVQVHSHQHCKYRVTVHSHRHCKYRVPALLHIPSTSTKCVHTATVNSALLSCYTNRA